MKKIKKKNPPPRRGILSFKPDVADVTDVTDITDITDVTDSTDFIGSIEGSHSLPELEYGLVGKVCIVRSVRRVCSVSKAGALMPASGLAVPGLFANFAAKFGWKRVLRCC